MLMEVAKKHYKDLVGQNPLELALENIELSTAHRRSAKLAAEVQKYGFNLREELTPFIESRKRFIASLPKIKYGDMHDRLYGVLKQQQTVIYYFSYLYPLYISALKCIKNMKQATKKGIYIMNGQEESREDKLRKIDDIDCARIYAFMMFINFICRVSGIEISEKLYNVFKSLSTIAKYFLADDFM